jgi:hypothetical protein
MRFVVTKQSKDIPMSAVLIISILRGADGDAFDHMSLNSAIPRGQSGHFTVTETYSAIAERGMNLLIDKQPESPVYFLWLIGYAHFPSLLGFLRVVLPGCVALLCRCEAGLPEWSFREWGGTYSAWDRAFPAMPHQLYGLVSQNVGPGTRRDLLGLYLTRRA